MAATSFSLPTFPSFDVHADGNTGHRWKKWLGRFERLLVAMNITDKKQQHVDKEIKNQIIVGCSSQKLRRKALREDPTLKNLLDAGRAEETSQIQAQFVEKQESSQNINAIKTGALEKHNPSPRDMRKPQNQRHGSNYQRNFNKPPTSTCRNCGGIYPHARDCPAKGKECHSCKKTGHFAKIRRLEALDIIEQVDGPTPWVSPIVVVPKKSGEIRLCVDMREANKAVQREKHPMPTVDELITDLNGAIVFSTLDLASGYHQLELHPESRHITTFTTHVGLRRYKRLMFGINAASEIFQNAIANLLVVRIFRTDIIVYGRDDKEHDENLRGVLNRLQDNNAKLNGEKCSFRQHQVVFFEHTFSASEVQADPKKIDIIRNMQPPRNVSEVKSLLGMTQYVSHNTLAYPDPPERQMAMASGTRECSEKTSTRAYE
ncbi:Retrovirus-related Pol poly from transposon [Paramuricea clavata]|uniref:Retrovirus-related Pol poly from transposon n=1 Tax=Paramuricea clavata TaxID=317549 RepID=A0A6S7GBQ8_PARCT|nr:Retrovirus-related Pol poly from transposon [Paramuricea clavata]